MTFDVQFRGPARRALSDYLPEAVATATYEFCIGPLAENPHRVGRQLNPPLQDYRSARRGTYRVIYEIHESFELVTVEWIGHRSDAYRPR